MAAAGNARVAISAQRERRALVGLLGGESEATTAQSYADVAHLIFNMSELIFLR